MKKTVPFLLLVILFAAAAWYSVIREPETIHEAPVEHQPPAMPVAKRQQQQAPIESSVEEIIGYLPAEPVEVPEPLLPLNDSDPQFSQSLADLVGTDAVSEYLIRTEVISRMVVTIDSLTGRQVAAQINPIKPAEEKFIADIEGDKTLMSAQNFARYDGYVALLQNADSADLVALYQHYSPLFQLAWQDNGGEGMFEQRLLEVLDHLTETPDIPGPVYLSKPEAVYLFIDPVLENMSAGQKILVRMGSLNASIVKEKLLELRAQLTM